LGKGSGIDSVKNALDAMGVSYTNEEAMQVVNAVKDYSLKHKSLLTDQEMKEVVAKVLPKAVLAKA
jgi:isopropylmalate/homocitrate/citramalate synthase